MAVGGKGGEAGRVLRILELGTCLGSGADYLLTGAGKHADYIGLEGSSALAALTRARLGHHLDAGASVEIRVGPFSETLPALVKGQGAFDVVFMDGCHEGRALLEQWSLIRSGLSSEATVVVDDIRWSKEMHHAWLKLCSEPGWSSLDLFRVGMLFRHPAGPPGGGGPRRCAWRERA